MAQGGYQLDYHVLQDLKQRFPEIPEGVVSRYLQQVVIFHHNLTCNLVLTEEDDGDGCAFFCYCLRTTTTWISAATCLPRRVTNTCMASSITALRRRASAAATYLAWASRVLSPTRQTEERRDWDAPWCTAPVTATSSRSGPATPSRCRRPPPWRPPPATTLSL